MEIRRYLLHEMIGLTKVAYSSTCLSLSFSWPLANIGISVKPRTSRPVLGSLPLESIDMGTQKKKTTLNE